jgi:hypothetical protein
MNSNLDTCISLREIGLEYTCLHDEEAIKDLHGVQGSLNKHSLPLSHLFAVSPYPEQ